MAAMQRGNCSVCGYLRHGLAQGVAEYLASVDGTLKAVYAYEPEYATSIDEPIGGGPSASPGISMILWVERKSAALSSVVNMLGLALGEEVRQLACPKSNAMCHTLDVHVVDDSEVLGRTGYGALIDSMYVRPVRIWQR